MFVAMCDGAISDVAMSNVAFFLKTAMHRIIGHFARGVSGDGVEEGGGQA